MSAMSAINPHGIRALGYLRVQTADLDRWRELAVDGLGFAIGTGPEDGALYLRMDERRARLILLPGDVDKVLAVGWEVRDRHAFESVRAAVEDAGIAADELSETEATARSAERVLAFTDPVGTPIEVFFNPILDHSPVVATHGNRFVTEGVGMGHVILPTSQPDKAVAF